MERERQNDPYGPSGSVGSTDDRGSLDPRVLLRYGMAGLGAILIIVGLMLSVSVFGVVRDIIESPDGFVSRLDAWAGPSPAEEAPSPVQEQAAGSPPSAAPATTAENEPVSAPDAAASTDKPESGDAAPPAILGLRANSSYTGQRAQPQDGFDQFLDLIREGGMGRIVGAVFILLFVTVLARIPIGLIHIGVGMMKSASGSE